SDEGMFLGAPPPSLFLLKDKNSDQQAPDEADQECHYLAGLLEVDICCWLLGSLRRGINLRVCAFPKTWRSSYGFAAGVPYGFIRSVQKVAFHRSKYLSCEFLGVGEAEAKRYTSRDATIAQLHTFISRAA